MCSFAMGTCRDWLFRSRQRMESKSLVRGKTVAFGAQALEKSESKLSLEACSFFFIDAN